MTFAPSCHVLLCFSLSCLWLIVFLGKESASLLEGEGVVVLAGLAVPHQVAGLLTQPEQRLCVCPADRSMVPAAVNNRK